VLNGSLLVTVAFWGGDIATGVTVTDDCGNIWTPIGTPLEGTSTLDTYRIQMFYCSYARPGRSGTLNVTLTVPGASAAAGLSVHEFDCDGAMVLDTFKYGAGNVTAVKTEIITPSVENAVIVAGMISGGFAVDSVGNGFSLTESIAFDSNGTAIMEDSGEIGPKYCTFNMAGQDLSLTAIAAFRRP
jgi:hypothetical protein